MMLDHKWLVIVNPNAGNRKGEKDWNKISAILKKNDIPFFPVFTKHQSHALELTKQYINESFKKIISIGGDGTLNEIVNGIFLQKKYPTRDISLGAISVGTGNDWGRMYNIPVDYEEAISVIKAEKTFIQDTGLVEFNNSQTGDSIDKTEKKYFINAAGIGFDARVVKKVNDKKSQGKASSKFSYLIDLFSSLFSYRMLQANITIDKNEFLENIFSMSIGINRFSGGGMKQLPNAIPDDGLFDIIIIKDISKPAVIGNVHKLYDGSIGSHPKASTFKAKTVIVESQSGMMLQADGESLGFSPFKFTIIPKSLKIVVNKYSW